MPPEAPDLSIYQLMALRALLTQGWPDSLLTILWSRCSLPEGEWLVLVTQGYVNQDEEAKWWVTPTGKKAYRDQKKGKYF